MPSFVYIEAVNPPSFAYGTNVVDTTDLTNYSFASVSIGTAAANRYVVVAVFLRGTGGNVTISSLTVGGIAATSVVESVDTAAGLSRVALYIAAVPTGTTATVAVNCSGALVRAGIGTYALYDLTSGTAIATNNSTASPANLNVNTTANKVLIAAAYDNNNASITWTGVTSNFDVNLEGGRQSAGSLLTSSAETPRTVTGTYAVGSNRAAVSALFG